MMCHACKRDGTKCHTCSHNVCPIHDGRAFGGVVGDHVVLVHQCMACRWNNAEKGK